MQNINNMNNISYFNSLIENSNSDALKLETLKGEFQQNLATYQQLTQQ